MSTKQWRNTKISKWIGLEDLLDDDDLDTDLTFEPDEESPDGM